MMLRPERRALFISPIVPDLTGNGLAMRCGMFLEALARVASVDLLVLPVSGSMPSRRFAERIARQIQLVRVAGRLDTQWQLISMMRSPDARLAAFTTYGRGSRHAFMSLPVLADVRAAAGAGYDLVHTQRLYLADAAMAVDAPWRTLDLDEDDAWAWRQAQTADNQAWREAEAQAEDKLLERARGCIAKLFISGDADRQTVLARHPDIDLSVVPNAVPMPAVDRADDGHTLLFVGSFGYAPNVDGIRWFVSNVLPLIPPRLRVTIRLVGRGMTDAIGDLADGDPRIEIVGDVEDLGPLYRSAAIAIAPLRTGGGTRLKVIEALAHAVPVVATTVALRGIEVADTTVWRADEAPAFAAAIVAALADAEARNARGKVGRRFAAERHDRRRVVDTLAETFAALLELDR